MTIDRELTNLVEQLEHERSLDEPRNLRQRVEALDELAAYLPDEQPTKTVVDRRARSIQAKLESINSKLYEAIRREIRLGAKRGQTKLLQLLPDLNDPANFTRSSGYDYLDELLCGVLRFEEPPVDMVKLAAEMVAYQPTPARHIFDFIVRARFTERDFLIDLGSGLGHVTLTAAICTGASCTGIELEPSYVECARKSAASLNLRNASFIRGDARAVDFSKGTIFYLYTPFKGSILRDVLDALRHEAKKRKIRICTFGPCTLAVAKEPWLKVIGTLEADRIAVFRSCH